MSSTFWGIIIAVVVVGSLLFAYWEHGVRGRRLAQLFRRYVRHNDGKIVRGNPLVFPQLFFTRDGMSYRVTAMASAGADAANRGPFTTVAVTLPGDTGRRIRLTRRAGVLSAVVDKVSEALAVDEAATTGDQDFDRTFRASGADDTFLRDLLSRDVRATLVNAPLDNLEVDVDRTEIRVHCSGVVSTPAELEALIGCTAALADRFLPAN